MLHKLAVLFALGMLSASSAMAASMCVDATYDSLSHAPPFAYTVPKGDSVVAGFLADPIDNTQHYTGIAVKVKMATFNLDSVRVNLLYDVDRDGLIDGIVPLIGPEASKPWDLVPGSPVTFTPYGSQYVGGSSSPNPVPAGCYRPSGSLNSLYGWARGGIWRLSVAYIGATDSLVTLNGYTVYLQKPQIVGVDSFDPHAFHLECAPNPLTTSSQVRFAVSRGGVVNVKVYDAQGRVVRSLANGYRPSGAYSVSWDGHDDVGARVSSGVYFVRMASPEGQKVVRLSRL